MKTNKPVTIRLNARDTVTVVKNEYISIVRDDTTTNIFKLGDIAEHSSYNLSYYGEILSITDKTVTIQDRRMNRKYRLKLDVFAWRNYNFNLVKVQAENANTMMYI